jgi:K+ transporter
VRTIEDNWTITFGQLMMIVNELCLFSSLLCMMICVDAIVGVSVAVLVVLFASQRYGSGSMGAAFAPIVIIWLALNAGVGIYQLSTHGGDIFASLNPLHIVDFFAR